MHLVQGLNQETQALYRIKWKLSAVEESQITLASDGANENMYLCLSLTVRPLLWKPEETQ